MWGPDIKSAIDLCSSGHLVVSNIHLLILSSTFFPLYGCYTLVSVPFERSLETKVDLMQIDLIPP